MSKTKSPQEKELESLKLYHSDGGLDIIIGALMLNLGLDVLNQGSSASLFTWIPLFVYTTIKNRFTLPRLKAKNIDIDEQLARYWTRQSIVGMAIGLLLVSMFSLGDAFELKSKVVLPWNGDLHTFLFGLISAAGLLAAGWYTKYNRFYYYAAAVMGISLVSCFLLPAFIPVFISAAIILVFGFRVMSAFTHQYPDPQAPEIKKK